MTWNFDTDKLYKLLHEIIERKKTLNPFKPLNNIFQNIFQLTIVPGIPAIWRWKSWSWNCFRRSANFLETHRCYIRIAPLMEDIVFSVSDSDLM